MLEVGVNCQKILARIEEAAAKARRNPQEIKLLGASKTQSVEAIQAAIAAGVKLIGENYVQEAKDKQQRIPQAVEWHMIGHLQRNKARSVVEIFGVVESLDSLALARELDKEAGKVGKTLRVLIEVNLAGEKTKSGIAKEEVTALLREAAKLAHLRIEGLMTVPPFHENVEKVRPYFRELWELREALSGLRLPNVDLKELSMGMTHDYPVAIEEGATIVRIGTALFGPRGD